MEEREPPDADPDEAGYLPPDPDEPPPVELWSAVGDVVPWGTVLLMLTWAIMFLLFAVRGDLGRGDALLDWGASATGLAWSEAAWRLLGSTFLHSGPAHVFFNGIAMLLFGSTVERLFHRSSFWTVFAVGGAAASLASLLWRTARHGDALSLSVGASGAVFALGGAVLVAAVRLRRRLAPGRARALGASLVFLVAQGITSGLTRHATDNAAHAAGLVAGLALGAALPLSERLGAAPAGPIARGAGVLAALALLAAFATGAVRGLTAP